MQNKRIRPEINAGSMADIAFLLLIFFLVTTTMDTDIGIQRKLPPISDINTTNQAQKRNILEVLVNGENKLLINQEYANISDLKEKAIQFLDNNGKGECTYCTGSQLPYLSDHPSKAVISIQNDRNTSYNLYVAVQNELTSAYKDLREREAQKIYGKTFEDLTSNLKKEIKKKFPILISEAETVNLD